MKAWGKGRSKGDTMVYLLNIDLEYINARPVRKQFDVAIDQGF